MGFEKVTEIIKVAPSFTQLTDLAAARLGGKVLYATDDFFAEKENLLKAGRGIFIPDKYTDKGKWMDGWESRRKRTPGHDWCIVQLATTGRVHGVDIDTNHFLGNRPDSIDWTNGNAVERQINKYNGQYGEGDKYDDRVEQRCILEAGNIAQLHQNHQNGRGRTSGGSDG